MGFVVAALSQTGDITELAAALTAAGLSPDHLSVVDGEMESIAPRGIIGAELLTSDGGTAVPGINTTPSRPHYFEEGTLAYKLSEMRIPESEIENYFEALEAGRSVVAYTAPSGDPEAVTAIFRAANLMNVRTF
jgi:hypothetical protein